MHFVSIHIVHPFSSIDTATVWKKYHLILSDRSNFDIDNLSVAIHIKLGISQSSVVSHCTTWTNPGSSTQEVSGEFSISQSSEISHFITWAKASGTVELSPILPKYCITFDSL